MMNEPVKMDQLNENEKAFIDFYNNMATKNTQESGSQFIEIPQVDNTQTGAAITVVTPTQATVQRAQKQVLKKAPIKRAKTAATKKKAMRSKQAKRISKIKSKQKRG